MLALIGVSACFAVVFVLLGIWQLRRHQEQLIVVREYSSRMARAPVSLAELGRADSSIVNTPVVLEGRYDVANEMILVNRTRRGAPGAHVITPMRVPGIDNVVLVNRGWVYSADGFTVDLSQWRDSVPEYDTASAGATTAKVLGLALLFSDSSGSGRHLSTESGVKRLSRMTVGQAEALLPYSVHPVYVQLLPVDTVFRPGVPTPVPPPLLTSGPHRSYAIQWFAFAMIAVVGCALVVRQSSRERTAAPE